MRCLCYEWPALSQFVLRVSRDISTAAYGPNSASMLCSLAYVIRVIQHSLAFQANALWTMRQIFCYRNGSERRAPTAWKSLKVASRMEC